jgi:hypothetical protein
MQSEPIKDAVPCVYELERTLQNQGFLVRNEEGGGCAPFSRRVGREANQDRGRRRSLVEALEVSEREKSGRGLSRAAGDPSDKVMARCTDEP